MRLSTHGERGNELSVPDPIDHHQSTSTVRPGDTRQLQPVSRKTVPLASPTLDPRVPSNKVAGLRHQRLTTADGDDDIGSELPTLSDRSSGSNEIPIPTASMPIISISGHYDEGVITENHYDSYDVGTSMSSSTGSIGHGGVDGLSPRDDAIYNIGNGPDVGSGGKKIRRDSSPSPIGNHLSVSPRLDSIPNGPPSPSNMDMSAHIKDLFLGSAATERTNTAQHPAENFIRAISPMHSASDFLDLHFPASLPSSKGKSHRSHSHSVLKTKSRSVDDISELQSTDYQSETSPTGSPIPDNRSFIEEFINGMGGMEGLPELSLDSQQRAFAQQPSPPPWNRSRSPPQHHRHHHHHHHSQSLQQSQYLDPSPTALTRESGGSNTTLSPPPPDLYRQSPPTNQSPHQHNHHHHHHQHHHQQQQNFTTQQSGSTPQETHLPMHSSPSHTQPSHSVEHPHGEHPSRTLFVRNINSTVEDEELRVLFEAYGSIRHMYTQCKHRGFVMISYHDIRDAKNAMRHLQGNAIRRRKIDIHYSIPKENPSEKDQNQGTLVVFNLDPSIENDDILAVFSQYGEVKEIRETPNKRHHRFIEYFDVRDAEKALKFLNKTEIRGKRIKIEPSRPGGARKAYSYQWNAGNDLSLLPMSINDAVTGMGDMSNLSSALANLTSTHLDAPDAFGNGAEGGMAGGGDAQYGRYPMNMASQVAPPSHEEFEAMGQAPISRNATSSSTRSSHKSLPLPIPEHSLWQPAPSPPALTAAAAAAYGGFVMATPTSPYPHSPWHVAQQSPQMADSALIMNPHALVVSPSLGPAPHPQFRHFESPHGVDMVHRPMMMMIPQPAASTSPSPGQPLQQQPHTIGIGLPYRHYSWPIPAPGQPPPSAWTPPPHP